MASAAVETLTESLKIDSDKNRRTDDQIEQMRLEQGRCREETRARKEALAVRQNRPNMSKLQTSCLALLATSRPLKAVDSESLNTLTDLKLAFYKHSS